MTSYHKIWFHSMSEYCLTRNVKFYQLSQSQNKLRFNDMMMWWCTRQTCRVVCL